MFSKLGYDSGVLRLNRATVRGFGGLAILLLASIASAQINAAPPSVTSQGFGGHAISGVSPSVTSLGPHGYAPGSNPAFPNSQPRAGISPNAPQDGHHHPHHTGGYYPWGGAVYAVPYYGYYENGGDAANEPDEPYNGGPTIFDRRGSGTAPRPPASDYADSDPAPSPSAEATPAKDQPETVLVFKDGHQLEVANYAIVGSTLYDLTDGHRRKVMLAELDLPATAKQNDDRGIDFQLPSTQGN